MNAGPNDHYKYLKGNCANSLFFAPVSSADVEEMSLSLRNKPGNINTFSTSVLKRIKRHVHHVLRHVINLSLRTGIFQDCLKLARVTPIPKGGDSTNACNNRPISVLPIFSKIFEKLVYKQLYTYFEQNNILNDHQYGFRKDKSTAQAFLNHIQITYDSIDSGNFVISVFLDFKKASDTVDHKIVLSKLDFYGIRRGSHVWLKSYLSERNQIIVIDGIPPPLLQ